MAVLMCCSSAMHQPILWAMVDERLRRELREHPAVVELLPRLLEGLDHETTTPTAAALALLDAAKHN